MYYQFWAFAGSAAVADGYYPGLTPLNPDALAMEVSLAFEQFVSANPGLEIGGYLYMDDRAGVYDATVTEGVDWGGVTPDINSVPSYGYIEGYWHSQFGATFNDRDAANPGFTSWVGTPEGTVFQNTGPGTTCIMTGPNPNGAYGGCP
jgi:hypothetical protein